MITSVIKAFWCEEDGQDLVEYALLMASISLAAVGLLGGMGNTIQALFTTLKNSLSTADTAASGAQSGGS